MKLILIFLITLTKVTILILIDGFLQYGIYEPVKTQDNYVTILILIDGFLQYKIQDLKKIGYVSHNPYFNRWFSAIDYKWIYVLSLKIVTILILIDGFLQYVLRQTLKRELHRHNPYFNRWFSAICP